MKIFIRKKQQQKNPPRTRKNEKLKKRGLVTFKVVSNDTLSQNFMQLELFVALENVNRATDRQTRFRF